MTKFKVGDVVILKSTKLSISHSKEVPLPLMTVVEEGAMCLCTWYAENQFKTKGLPENAIEIYTK